jgi:hypothetical protein
MDSWQQLTELLSLEYREELARAILEALASQQWHRIDIEIRDHRMHAVNVTKRITVQKVINRTNVGSKS